MSKGCVVLLYLGYVVDFGVVGGGGGGGGVWGVVGGMCLVGRW